MFIKFNTFDTSLRCFTNCQTDFRSTQIHKYKNYGWSYAIYCRLLFFFFCRSAILELGTNENSRNNLFMIVALRVFLFLFVFFFLLKSLLSCSFDNPSYQPCNHCIFFNYKDTINGLFFFFWSPATYRRKAAPMGC